MPLVRRRVGIALTLGMSLVAIGGTPMAAAEAAASCGTWRPVWSPNPAGAGSNHQFTDVAALSPTKAVAVGFRTSGARSKLFAERWDGRAWTATEAITPAGESALVRVARIDRSSAWAVGNRRSSDESHTKTLTERLSSDTWTVVPSPNRSGDTALSGVDAVSSDEAWAVGSSTPLMSFYPRTLAMHWDGTSWTIVPTPNPPGGSHLSSVDMLSASDGWAVGAMGLEGNPRMIIQRWDGTAWRAFSTPDIAGASGHVLTDVAVRSSVDAFAVGWMFDRSGAFRPLLLRWDGRAWKRVMTPALTAGIGVLSDVTMAGTRSAYAVGHQQRADGTQRALVVRWDGSAWARMRVSTASDMPSLDGVAAVSAFNVIAVGTRSRGERLMTFAVHCTP